MIYLLKDNTSYLPTQDGTTSQFPFDPHVAVVVLTLLPDTAYPVSHKYVTVSPSLTPVLLYVESGTFVGFPHVTETPTYKIVALFRGMRVSPAKHSFEKCDRRTDIQQTDERRIK